MGLDELENVKLLLERKFWNNHRLKYQRVEHYRKRMSGRSCRKDKLRGYGKE